MSSHLSREAAIERQDLDDGGPQDTVYVPTNKRSVSRIYHDDPECSSLKGRGATLREYSREAAQRRWTGPCRRCVLQEADDAA